MSFRPAASRFIYYVNRRQRIGLSTAPSSRTFILEIERRRYSKALAVPVSAFCIRR